MSLKDDPALSWLFGTEKPGSFEELVRPIELTHNIGDFIKVACCGSTSSFREELQSAWNFLHEIYGGLLKPAEDNTAIAALVRASELEIWCKKLEESIDRVESLHQAGVAMSSGDFIDAAHWLLHDYLHIFYLRREILFMATFLPMANRAQRSESAIPGMGLRDRLAIEARNENWKKWADQLVSFRPELRGNKRAIAEDLKKAYGVNESVRTIRRIL